MSQESSSSIDIKSKFKKNVAAVKRESTPDKLADLNRPYVPRINSFELGRQIDVDCNEPLLFLNFVSASLPSKSIIKKESAYKEEHEKISKLKKQENSAHAGKKLIRKVQFADLSFVDDVDDYMRNEEMNYHKVTRLSKPKR